MTRPTAGLFPTTHWTQIDLAANDGGAAQREALEKLLIRYLPALKAHLTRRMGYADPDAEDLIQEFVAGKVLEKGLLEQADQERGRFRAFLLTALRNFARSAHRKASARKRSPGAGRLTPIDDAPPVARDDGPRDVFDAAWAREVLAEALRRMRRRCAKQEREDVWGVFELRLLKPLLDGADPAPYETVVERYHLASPRHAANLLTTAKRMFARALRSVVQEYTRDETEVEQEIADLVRVLAETPTALEPQMDTDWHR